MSDWIWAIHGYRKIMPVLSYKILKSGYCGCCTGVYSLPQDRHMIRKLRSGDYRLYSRKVNPRTGKRRNLGTFSSRAAAEKHERDVQYFKRH